MKAALNQMGGRNYGICHSCRDPGHWLYDCPTKKRCPRCGEGFVRLLEVEKIGARLNCRYFDWKKGESSTGDQIETKTKPDLDDLSTSMRTCARIANEETVT